jgi:hypothetical protein
LDLREPLGVTNIELQELLYAALHSPLGTVVESDDPEFLRQKLYAVRRENTDFLPLSFVISPMNPRDLWIINKGTTDATS